MTKKVKEYIGFHDLFIEMQLYTLILLELNMFLKKYPTKSEINLSHRIYLEYKMCGFYCITFIEYILVGKTLLYYTNLTSSNDYRKNGNIIYKYLMDKYVKS